MLADFQAVAELGWIAGCGVLLCAFACFTVLPSLLIDPDRSSCLTVAGGLSVIHAPRAERIGSRPSRLHRIGSAHARLCSQSKPGCRPRWVPASRDGVPRLVLRRVRWQGRPVRSSQLLRMQGDGLDSVQWSRMVLISTARPGPAWGTRS